MIFRNNTGRQNLSFCVQNYFSFLVFHHRHNRIWSGRAAGVAVTEEGKGHILYNDIYGMEWGGVDIRNGGNPVVTNNWIRDGHADGIVIGEGGKGVIMDNDIRGTEMIVHHKFKCAMSRVFTAHILQQTTCSL